MILQNLLTWVVRITGKNEHTLLLSFCLHLGDWQKGEDQLRALPKQHINCSWQSELLPADAKLKNPEFIQNTKRFPLQTYKASTGCFRHATHWLGRSLSSLLVHLMLIRIHFHFFSNHAVTPHVALLRVATTSNPSYRYLQHRQPKRYGTYIAESVSHNSVTNQQTETLAYCNISSC
jgi:hypothetical protein